MFHSDPSRNKLEMSWQKNPEPPVQLLDAEQDRQTTQPPHSHKASASSPARQLAKRKSWGSIAENCPRSSTATTSPLPFDAYLKYLASLNRPVPREGPRSRKSDLAKTLISRGSRLLKRQNSKVDSASSRTLEWLEESGKNLEKNQTPSSGLDLDDKRESLNLSDDGKHEAVKDKDFKS